jgi:hypothetical protein
MCAITFLKSTPGRVVRGAAGLWLVAYGLTHASLLGLVLMMVGIVPLVTAVAGICLIEEVLRGTTPQAAQPFPPRERRV